jgi:microcystin degradation protein MlrC
MRLLIAMMQHETNTFSPVPTPLARFGRGGGVLRGAAAIAGYRGTGTAAGAYIDLAEKAGAEIVFPRSPIRSAPRWPRAVSTASCSTCTAPW